MNYCDINSNILEWGSEEIIIPYTSPVDGKIHKYYPDFYIKVKDKSGNIKKNLIEVKPKYQTVEPKIKKQITRQYIKEVVTYSINKAKWKAAEEFCDDHKWQFIILTEHELKI